MSKLVRFSSDPLEKKTFIDMETGCKEKKKLVIVKRSNITEQTITNA